MVRAKFQLTYIEDSKERYGWGDGKVLHFTAVTAGSEENDSFFESTPSGSLQMHVTNETALAHFEEGAEYYLDFTKAD